MAYQHNPDDPPYMADPASEEIRRDRRPHEAQIDPELAEGRASGSRIAIFAIGIAIVLGMVFYGLNNSTTNPTATPPSSTASSAGSTANQGVTAQSGPAAANAEPGVTTGAAPSQPRQQPVHGASAKQTANPSSGGGATK